MFSIFSAMSRCFVVGRDDDRDFRRDVCSANRILKQSAQQVDQCGIAHISVGYKRKHSYENYFDCHWRSVLRVACRFRVPGLQKEPPGVYASGAASKARLSVAASTIFIFAGSSSAASDSAS